MPQEHYLVLLIYQNNYAKNLDIAYGMERHAKNIHKIRIVIELMRLEHVERMEFIHQ